MDSVIMEAKILVFIILQLELFLFSNLVLGAHSNGGSWELLKKSIGISSMHIQLLQNERIITFDRTDAGPSNLTLPKGRKCPKISGRRDCYVHAVELDMMNNLNVRPLTVLSDTWCSSGSMLPDGKLVQSGGYGNGEKVVRTLEPCPTCDWKEDYKGLISPRWYASNQVLPGGNIIVVGGRFQFSYEFIPKSSKPEDHRLYTLPFLKETRYSSQIPNNLYPFTHLSTDGNLFIFANNRGILLDYVKNKVVKTYPTMPGEVARNYPSTGSSVLLPLDLSTKTTPEAETENHSRKPQVGNGGNAHQSSIGRHDHVANRRCLDHNGAANGSAGWWYARVPVYNPVIYRPAEAATANRFEILKAATIPRLYHSTAHLLSDGRVLVAGSNPNHNYNFTVPFPTELSVEAFSPPYLTSGKPRPSISSVKPGMNLAYKQKFSVEFQVKVRQLGKFYLTMVAPSFTTHSFSMNQRLLLLAVNRVRRMSSGSYAVEGDAPASAAFAPPGYYQLFVVYEGVPSVGKWLALLGVGLKEAIEIPDFSPYASMIKLDMNGCDN
ncbi:Aldehyde oxidase GLOX1 [Vitis vinifera]|uniref:Aldehyde oxidase GLOX1 n=1 Tax=Vitis vinifera TaxID=29760 RepID=A0A438I4G2_VITVI|nr:Aldehyde oxidase GLOX1 [Vitis vinifera]